MCSICSLSQPCSRMIFGESIRSIRGFRNILRTDGYCPAGRHLMSSSASALVNKVWNYCNLLRDDGVSYGDYVEQLTWLRDDSLGDSSDLPDPAILAAEIVE